MIIRLRSIAELMCKHHIILIEMCNLLLRFSSFLLEGKVSGYLRNISKNHSVSVIESP